MDRNFYVLAYDIADDRRRQKIARLCESVAERVQGSVFEAYLTPPELKELVRKSGKVMKKEDDSLRIYYLCSACREKAETHGRGNLTSPPGLVIV